MTQANPFKAPRRNISVGAGSVGIERGTRYLRRLCAGMSNNADTGNGGALPERTREVYSAPTADVILYPDTVERAALAELMKDETAKPSKEPRAGLRERIREARHRSSDTYTLYGVDTCELFTAEYEIDISPSDGAAPTMAEAAKNTEERARATARHASLGKLKQSISSSMRRFAYKLNRLRID